MRAIAGLPFVGTMRVMREMRQLGSVFLGMALLCGGCHQGGLNAGGGGSGGAGSGGAGGGGSGGSGGSGGVTGAWGTPIQLATIYQSGNIIVDADFLYVLSD